MGEDPKTPFLPKLSMTVQINHKKLYYNYYSAGKFLTFNFKFLVKSPDTPMHPPTSDASLCPWALPSRLSFISHRKEPLEPG